MHDDHYMEQHKENTENKSLLDSETKFTSLHKKIYNLQF